MIALLVGGVSVFFFLVLLGGPSDCPRCWRGDCPGCGGRDVDDDPAD